MSKKEKTLLQVLDGKQPSYTPIWLMRQAGRYLPEYRALRAQAGSFMQLCFNPHLASEVTLQPIRRFGMDGAILFSDILVVPYGLGFDLEFVEGEGPKLQTLEKTLPHFSAEKFFDRTQTIYQTLRLTKPQLPPHVTLIGFAGSPWTVACYLLGGKGADEFVGARLRAYRDQGFFKQLLAVLVEATAFYLVEQIKAGAEVLQLFDSWSGLVPAALYQDWVLEPTAALVAKIKAIDPNIPIIGFPRMSGSKWPLYADVTKVDAISLDQTVDLALAQAQLPSNIFQGNLDPLLMQAEPEVLLAQARQLLASTKKPFIFNLGHGLTPQVPPEHVAALVHFVQGYRYA